MTTTTSMASPSVPSGPTYHSKHTIHAQTASTQTTLQNMWIICHPTASAALIPGTLRLVLRGGLGWHQTKGERENQSNHKKGKQENCWRGEKEEERALSSRTYVPYLLNDEANLPLTNPPVSASEKKEKNLRETKRSCDRLLTPSPICMASYEEDTPNLVDTLIPRPTLKERRYKQERRQQDNYRHKKLDRNQRWGRWTGIRLGFWMFL